ncbi:hypothetical protein Tco_1168889 [Tanacetum coccineum]
MVERSGGRGVTVVEERCGGGGGVIVGMERYGGGVTVGYINGGVLPKTEVAGLPPQAWHEAAFTRIARIRGEIYDGFPRDTVVSCHCFQLDSDGPEISDQDSATDMFHHKSVGKLLLATDFRLKLLLATDFQLKIVVAIDLLL